MNTKLYSANAAVIGPIPLKRFGGYNDEGSRKAGK